LFAVEADNNMPLRGIKMILALFIDPSVYKVGQKSKPFLVPQIISLNMSIELLFFLILAIQDNIMLIKYSIYDVMRDLKLRQYNDANGSR